MTTSIALSELVAIFPMSKKETLEPFIAPLMQTFERFDISTVARKAAFIAQVGHESAAFTATKENLNYSQQSLLRVFPKYFKTEADAAAYARQPEMIAARVYANRMGNGDEASKEGWKFRGRGLIQITGKYNYTELADFLEKSIDDTVAYLETVEGATISAGWFWHKSGLNALADQTRFTDMTRKINGGVNGLEDRKAIWGRAKQFLK